MSRPHASTTREEQPRAGSSQGEPVPAEPAPLDFDSEADLLALLDRMRQELRQRVADAVERAQHGDDNKGKGKARESINQAKVEEIVQKVSLPPSFVLFVYQDSSQCRLHNK